MRHAYWYVLGVCLLTGCPTQPTSVTFEFVHGTAKNAPTYRATTTKPGLIARVRTELQHPDSERRLHIHGKIVAGPGADNAPWNWHFDENEWDLADVSMELCDGEPTYVNDHLKTWLAEVGSYCPWASRVLRER